MLQEHGERLVVQVDVHDRRVAERLAALKLGLMEPVIDSPEATSRHDALGVADYAEHVERAWNVDQAVVHAQHLVAAAHRVEEAEDLVPARRESACFRHCHELVAIERKEEVVDGFLLQVPDEVADDPAFEVEVAWR